MAYRLPNNANAGLLAMKVSSFSYTASVLQLLLASVSHTGGTFTYVSSFNYINVFFKFLFERSLQRNAMSGL